MKILLVLTAFTLLSSAHGLITWTPHNSATNIGDLNLARFCEALEPSSIPIYQLEATGAGTMTYSILTPEFTVYVNLDSATGELFLIKKFDREVSSVYTVELSATDGIDITQTTSLVRIEDANDNPPIFQNLPYETKIYEYPWTEKSLLTFSATDADDGVSAALTYVLTDASNQLSIAGTDIKVKDDATINYEDSPIITATLNATDGGGSALCGDDVKFWTTTTVIVSVLDGPDQEPFFLSAPYYADVQENIKNVPVVTVQALDQDFGVGWSIEYSIIPDGEVENIFSIDANTGEIMVTGDIDADSDAISNNGIYTFSVMAKEVVPPDNPFPQMNIGFPFNITTAVSVTVHDVNDNGPIFYETAADGTNIPETTFNTSIDENTSDFIAVPGLSIYVKDKDKGANAAFTLTTNSPAFEVVPAQVNGEAAVNLRVKDSTLLDFETTQHFMVEITATEDSATKNFSAMATVHIDITDINDNSPEFVNDTFVTTVPEDVPDGSIVALVQATDKDTGSFGEITYSIVSLTPSVDFAINNRTGEVTVASTLDRERNPSYYASVRAEDGGGRFSIGTLQITVSDVNDVYPQFQRSSYSAVIKEGESEFTPHLAVYAIDDDERDTPNSRVRYFIADGDLSDNFTMSPSDAQYQKEGDLLLVAPLDFESIPPSMVQCDNGAVAVLHLLVGAQDVGNPPLTSFVNITVTVEDVNDHDPRIEFPDYSVDVPERSVSSTEILKLRAFDDDSCSPNNLLDFLIETGSSSDPFIITTLDEGNQTVGILKTKDGNLDHESVDSYTLTILATDGGSTRRTGSATVVVTVTDVNDVPPEFVGLPFPTLEILEDSALAEIAEFNATDVDVDHDLKFTLTSVECQDESNSNLPTMDCDGYFEVVTMNEVGVLKLIQDLDRETIERFTLTLQVNDTMADPKFASQAVSTTISVLVSDVNDNDPRFTSSQQSFSVNEEDTSAFVGQVTATDPDKGENGTITYSVDGTFADYFSISNDDVTKGQLTTVKAIDREVVGDALNITIIASDGGNPLPRRSSFNATVDINDINDNSPEYTQSNYTASIPETSVNPSHVITVHASDMDSISKGYGAITYIILRGDDFGQFEINRTTGEILVAPNKVLDREVLPTYTLTVQASDDFGQPGSHKVTTAVRIEIDDVNDNPPKFPQSTYPVYIREDADNGAVVGTVTAMDSDVGVNSEIEYSIIDGNDKGHFEIDGTTGTVTLSSNIRNDDEMYTLNISATDTGVPPLSGSCLLQISVIDANINYPQFVGDPASQTVTVMEAIPPGEFVFEVNATDRDRGINGEVYFLLLNHNDKFEISYSSGKIKTSGVLDRETVETYQLEIQAKDGGDPPLTNTTTLTITVLDADDQAPYYTPETNQQTIVVEEEKDPFVLSSLVNKAEDDDLPENSNNYYFIVGGSGADKFTLNRTSRLLATSIKLDYETETSYELVIQTSKQNTEPVPGLVWNPNDPSLLLVTCMITDINDNAPVFSKPLYETDIPYDTQPSQEVTVIQIVATDADKGIPADLTYSIVKIEWILGSARVESPGTFGIQLSRDLTRGDIFLQSAINGDENGRYELSVKATDTNPDHVTTSTVKIGIIKSDETVILYSRYTSAEFETMEEQFVADMGALLHANVFVDKVIPHDKTNSQYKDAESDIYFHAKNGTYLIPKEEVLSTLGQQGSYAVLNAYGIVGNGLVSTTPENRTEDYLKAAVIIVAAVLIAVILVFSIAIYCMRRSYLRKLKVADAAEKANFDDNGIEARGPQHVPNTNVYQENPLHNIETENGIQLDWQLTQESRDDEDEDIDDNAVESNDSAIGDNTYQEMEDPLENQFDIDFDPKNGNNAQLAAALNAANQRIGAENLTFLFDDEVGDGNTAL